MYLHTYLLVILWNAGEALIGLRPPSADPTYRKHHPLPSVVRPVHHPALVLNQTERSIEKFILQRSSKNFMLTKDILEKLKNVTMTDKNSLHQTAIPINYSLKKACEPYYSLKCSIRFLKSTIRGEYNECNNWQDIVDCLCPHCMPSVCNIKQTLNTIIEDLKCSLESTTATAGSNICCREGLLKCTVDAYLDLRSKYSDCYSIERFTNCIVPYTQDLSSKDFGRIFKLILSLTKTCIYSIKT